MGTVALCSVIKPIKFPLTSWPSSLHRGDGGDDGEDHGDAARSTLKMMETTGVQLARLLSLKHN